MTKRLRLLSILWTLAHYRIDTLLPKSKAQRWLKLFVLINPTAWFNNLHVTRGQRLRLALEKLGPIFVKFGQTLSTRPDLLPADLITELSKLQDQVPPFSGSLVLRILQQAYGKPAQTVFQDFSIEPLASASVAQVHAATLLTGEDVIVKIIRPDIKDVIEYDIYLLYFLAKQLLKRWPDAERLKPVEVVREFEKTIFDELDMMREAGNASQLRRNFINSPIMYVPKIYWDYCNTNVLVMERIHGIRVSDIETLKSLGVDMKKLAERGVEIFYSQVFRDKFFHADMHPGNIFVDATDPADPKYLGVDFGIMGTLSDEDQYYLAQNFLAFFNRDYRKVAQLHIDSGWVAPETRVDEFEAAVRTVCEPISNKPLSQISFAIVLIRLFQVAQRFNMVVQPQLVLLQKTLLNVEGLGRQLYPDLNLWETAKPYLESVMKKQLGIRGFFKKVYERVPMWLEALPDLPQLIHKNLQHNLNTDAQQKQLALLQQLLFVKTKSLKRWRWAFGILLAIFLTLVFI